MFLFLVHNMKLRHTTFSCILPCRVYILPWALIHCTVIFIIGSLILISLHVYIVYFVDMINMLRLDYVPGQCEWIFPPGAAVASVAW